MRNSQPSTLRRRLSALFLVVGLLFAGAIATVVVSLIRLADVQDRQVNRVSPARADAAHLLATMIDQEAGVRGFALTARTDFLDPYESARAAEGPLTAELRQKLSSYPQLLTDIDAMTAASQAWRTDFADVSVAAVRAHGVGAASESLLVLGTTRFRAVMAAFDAFETDLTVVRAEARGHLRAAMTSLSIAVGISGLLLVFAAFWLRAGLVRAVIRPMESLARQVRSVAQGDLDHDVAASGPAEIVDLAFDVDMMRRRIVTELGVAQSEHEQVQRQARTLTVQAEDLRRSNAELEQFAYVASHDLQEPLRKVASFCQLLEQRYSGQLDERADTYLSFAADGARRMQRLIADLLAFSRVGRGGANSWVDVDCGEALERAMGQLAHAREEACAQITHDPLPVVRGDSLLLVQLFQNLLGNAIKFRGSQAPTIRVGVRRVERSWEFSCTDNGIGIEPEYAERIFAIFQRLHGRDQYDGTGIGLALCKKIVEYHGGRIWLDGSVESGTVFRWTLPASDSLKGIVHARP